MRHAWGMIFVAALAACSSGGSEPTGNGSPSPSGERISVPVGESRDLPGTGVTIEFLRVGEDSRCPVDVVCVWAGDGEVVVRLSTGAAERQTALHTTLEPRDTEFAGHRIALAGLEPQPLAATPIDPDDYVATFEVADD